MEPTTRNLLTVVVARLDVAATEKMLLNAALPEAYKLVDVASTITRLVIVEVELFASIPPVNCASPVTPSDVVVALVVVLVIIERFVIVEVALLTRSVPSVAMLVLMVVPALTAIVTKRTPATTDKVIVKPFLINEDSLFITTITMLN